MYTSSMYSILSELLFGIINVLPQPVLSPQRHVNQTHVFTASDVLCQAFVSSDWYSPGLDTPGTKGKSGPSLLSQWL